VGSKENIRNKMSTSFLVNIMAEDEDCLRICPCKSKMAQPVCPAMGDASRSKNMLFMVPIVIVVFVVVVVVVVVVEKGEEDSLSATTRDGTRWNYY
jgi:hypothetical protein